MSNVSESRLGTEKISKLMVQLAIPAIVAQLINVLYNMVDRMYIGRMEGEGALALTGLGVCFPVIIVITSFSMLVGAGGAPLAAIALGKQDKEEAEKILGNGVTILLIFSLVLPVVFYAIREPMLYLFGATENTIGYAMDYLSIYLLGTVFVQISMGLNQFISSQGQAKVAMLSVMIGAVINIVLDPIFIFGLGMGVKGAAIATVTSQAVSAIWIFRFLRSEKSAIRIKKETLRLDRRIVGMIAALGVSPFLVRLTESLIEIVFNNTLKRYGGDMYVGAMTICLSVLQMVFIVIQGFTTGVQPIVSYNYGARKFDRMRKACKNMIIVTFIASSVACLGVVLFPGIFARIFTTEAALIELVKRVLPIFFAGIWIFGLQMSIQAILLGLKQAKSSIFLAVLRKIILLVPLTLLLPRFFGVIGVYWAEPISDILSALVSVGVFMKLYRRLEQEETEYLSEQMQAKGET